MSAVYMGGVPVTGIVRLKVGAARITEVGNKTLGATDRKTTEFSLTHIYFMPCTHKAYRKCMDKASLA